MNSAGTPILPARPSDPTATDRQERGAMNRFAKVMRECTRAYKSALKRIPTREIVVNRTVYEFQLDPVLLARLLAEAEKVVDNLIIGDNWFFSEYIKPAADKGVAQSRQNMAKQARIPIEELRRSRAHGLRMTLVEARIFEEMKGLSAEVKADMARVLTDGMGRGLNPLDIARNLTQQTGIEINRANRIARTEISTALRRARM